MKRLIIFIALFLVLFAILTLYGMPGTGIDYIALLLGGLIGVSCVIVVKLNAILSELQALNSRHKAPAPAAAAPDLPISPPMRPGTLIARP